MAGPPPLFSKRVPFLLRTPSSPFQQQQPATEQLAAVGLASSPSPPTPAYQNSPAAHARHDFAQRISSSMAPRSAFSTTVPLASTSFGYATSASSPTNQRPPPAAPNQQQPASTIQNQPIGFESQPIYLDTRHPGITVTMNWSEGLNGEFGVNARNRAFGKVVVDSER